MIRQRLRLRQLGLAQLVTRLLVSALAAALVFYGAMFVLGALKLSPATINSISAFETVKRALESITASRITGSDRIVVAAAGVASALVCGRLLWRTLPRPYLARRELTAPGADGRGLTLVRPRAVERVAERAAGRIERINGARARCDRQRLEVSVSLADLETDVIDVLRSVQTGVRDNLAEHGLPSLAIDVTLAAAPKPQPVKETQP